jgi:hypothetical protein
MSLPRFAGPWLPDCEAAYLRQEIATFAEHDGQDLSWSLAEALDKQSLLPALEMVMGVIGEDKRALFALLEIMGSIRLGASNLSERRMAEVHRIKRWVATSPGRRAHETETRKFQAVVAKVMDDLPHKPTRGRAYAKRLRAALPKGVYRSKGQVLTPSVETVFRAVRAVLLQGVQR